MPIVELLTTHTHRGAVHRPGARLTVDAFTARWLITRGAATLVTEPDDVPDVAEPAVPTRRRTRRASAEPDPQHPGA